jgi:hypothetical protein
MVETASTLAEITDGTKNLDSNLVAAIKQASETSSPFLTEGEVSACLLAIKFAAEQFRQRYIGVDGWTADSEAILVRGMTRNLDHMLWFDPTSGKKMEE